VSRTGVIPRRPPLVLLWGLPAEEPLALVRHALQALTAETIMIDQRRALSTHVLPGPGGPVLRQPGRVLPLAEVTAAYLRPYPFPPPKAQDGPTWPVAYRHVLRLEHELWQWAATTTATVLSRPAPAASNATKPMQTRAAQACGFGVPDTLLTNDPEQARAFAARHGQVIYKAAGGTRTITGLLDLTDTRRLDRLSTCPIYFQKYIAGVNVRVHVVGRDVSAVEITSDAVDYRTDIDKMMLTRLPSRIAEKCRAVTEALELPIAGIDLIRAPAGEWYFLEANPSPAFTFYPDRATVGAWIARLLARPEAENQSLAADRGLPGVAHRHDAAPGAVALG
jgi:RimK-like ATP-grasp domain